MYNKSVTLLVLLVSFFSSPSLAANLSPYNISPSAKTANFFFKISNFGMDYFNTTEQYTQVVCYPTANDCTDQDGIFTPDPLHNAQTGDFNGDGFQDLALTVAYFPHTIERLDTPSKPIFYLNDGNGNLVRTDSIVKNYSDLKRHMLYRTAVADFNSDGKDDYLAGAMGMIKRNPDGSDTTKFEPNLLLLSGPDGKLYDASGNIEGQENGGLPYGFSFAHDLSWGDIDGDADIDFYTGGVLFLNDGTGKFSNAVDQLPDKAKTGLTSIMSSLIDDFDNDGKGDLVVFYMDSEEDANGSNSYIFISNGKQKISDRKPQFLTKGLFGANTKHNYANSADINNDGYKDLLVAQTRANPYYFGRVLQIFINQGDGSFIDDTSNRIDNTPRSDLANFNLDNSVGPNGEGVVYLLDVNNDGAVDIVDSTGAELDDGDNGLPGLNVFLNDGSGKFSMVDKSSFPHLQPYELDGFKDQEEWYKRPLQKCIPVNIDNKSGIDFVTIVEKPHEVWPDSDNQFMLYQFISTRHLTKLNSPVLTIETKNTNLSLSWPSVAGASGYLLYYAPYPLSSQSSVESIDLGNTTYLSIDLWEGAAFYVAIAAYDSSTNILSDIKHFFIPIKNAPTSYKNFKEIGIVPQKIPTSASARGYADFFNTGELSMFTASVTYDLDKSPNEATPGKFEFWKKQNDGTFILDTSLLESKDGCIHPSKTLIYDFNNDSRPDVFVACTGYGNEPYPGETNNIVLSQPDGSYLIEAASSDIGFYYAASAADLNADGYGDVIVVDNNDAEAAYLLLNMGNGTFQRQYDQILPSSIQWLPYFTIELIDLDEDYDLDLLIGGHEFEGADTLVLLNPGTNTFSTVSPIIIPPVPDEGVVLDFAVTGSGDERALWVLRTSGGDGTFYESRVIQKVLWPSLQSNIVLYEKPAESLRWIIPATVNGQNVITCDDANLNVVVPQ